MQPTDLQSRRSAAARVCAIGALAVLAWSAVSPVQAQQPIQIVIPVAAGGAMDITGRALGDFLSSRLSETVVPLNKPGASTLIGTEWVANQKVNQDRNLLLTATTFNTLQLRETRPYDGSKFTPVALVGEQPYILFIRSDIPAKTVDEFVKWGKARAEGVTFTTSGSGSGPHLAAAQFANRTGLKPLYIPTSGQAASIPLVVGGQVDAVFSGPSNRPLVEQGRLKALFVGTDKPLDEWPEIQASDQVGLKGLRLAIWYGVIMNASVPAADVERYAKAINESLSDPLMLSRLQKAGVVPKAIGGPANFAKYIAAEHAALKALVDKNVLTLE